MRIGDFGQPRVEALLDEMLSRGRVGGSFLFEGPLGVGKEAMAVELGRLLNCENDPPCPARPPFGRAPGEAPAGSGSRGALRGAPARAASSKRAASTARIESSETRPVGPSRCGSCHKFDILQHPDLLLVFPVPTGTWEEGGSEGRGGEFKPGAVGQILQAKARNPYYRHDQFERPASIQAEVLREHVLPAVASRPVEARFKTIILSDPEKMAFGMGNLLLKTLEEPPANCLLVLATAEPQRLLPTILSRCQRIRFQPLDPEWMELRLRELYDRPPAQVRLAASVSQGSMLAAARALEGDLDAARDFVFGVFEGAIDGQTLDLLETAQHLAQEHTKKRHLVPLTLQMLATTARDAVLVAQGVGAKATAGAGAGAGPRLVNTDRLAALERVAAAYSVEALHGIVRRAETAERQIAGNAFVEHTLAALFVDVGALAAQPAGTPGQKGRRR